MDRWAAVRKIRRPRSDEVAILCVEIKIEEMKEGVALTLDVGDAVGKQMVASND